MQAHCGEVEHDDDFGYECSEVEVEVQGSCGSMHPKPETLNPKPETRSPNPRTLKPILVLESASPS
jgi:hypothetical protein